MYSWKFPDTGWWKGFSQEKDRRKAVDVRRSAAEMYS
jgi:hypothetical protein